LEKKEYCQKENEIKKSILQPSILKE